MARVGKALVSFLNLMKEHVLYYVYFFFGRARKSMQVDILGSKRLPLLIENIMSTFVEDR
jgi:hypothetical protein